MSLSEEPQTRRRGAALESALLDAAWQELSERGYDALTIDGVAERAGTSRPVIYRRWAGKPELVQAALVHGLRTERGAVPDTGTLRGDLIALMRRANEGRVSVAIMVSARLGEFYRETGTSMADLRNVIVGDGPSSIEAVLDRAAARGEVDPATITPRIARLALDLLRLEVLMTFRPVPIEVIEEIVDTIFLPLVEKRGHQIDSEKPVARPRARGLD
ncbi:TetR/AcrR family transcriptional regulator [Propionibacterium sp.]|uniref:TetR/AcrR family transcriptional regulator n=1 Tax=Propionibacterium sp. TaxID=1977903 RepID=UPI0039E9E198